MDLTKELLAKLANDAQGRVENKDIGLQARLNSLETLNLCMQRADEEGWNFYRSHSGKWIVD